MSFLGKRIDITILKVRILLSRNLLSLRRLPNKVASKNLSKKLRESETTIKIKFAFFRGGGGGQGGREENCPKCYFSWEAPRQ